MNTYVSIFRGLDARGGRKLRTDTHTHTHTNTRDNYSNPCCAHARRGLINTCRRQESLRMMLKHNSQLNCSCSYPSKPRLVVTVVRLYIYGFSKWLLTQISHIHTATACVSPHVHSTHGCPTSKFVGANNILIAPY